MKTLSDILDTYTFHPSDYSEICEVVSKHLMKRIIKEWLTQKRQEPDWIKQEVIDELLAELE